MKRTAAIVNSQILFRSLQLSRAPPPIIHGYFFQVDYVTRGLLQGGDRFLQWGITTVSRVFCNLPV